MHFGEAEKVHREERQVNENCGGPEMRFAECLVVHVAGPLR